uniref:Taste receptor type 1 member 1-like n=1 Tax=Sphaeramia orbicularis TaxID=375764 RepID=A0A672YMJ3_9TELE
MIVLRCNFLHYQMNSRHFHFTFHLDGDYMIGGLFDVHSVTEAVSQDRPEAIDCSSQPFVISNYRRFQLMRFSVEEINNSTSLLPNVSLGYDIFDQCSVAQNFPGMFNLISVNDTIQPWDEPHGDPTKVSKMIAVAGPFSSTETRTIYPLLMMNFIPLVSYGAASSSLSEKLKYPSFLRTVHSNKDMIEGIVTILLHYNWRWVAFINSNDDYGYDGRDLFVKRIKDTDICLAYSKELNHNTNISQVFQQIEEQGARVIIAYVPERTAETLIGSAIQLNVTKKVWIAVEAWSLNKNLLRDERIQNIGTVLGVSQPVVNIPGFDEFIYSTVEHMYCENQDQHSCNQVCNCSDVSPEQIADADPSYSFPVYSAIYAIAHALHNTLQCGSGGCQRNVTVEPYMVLAELKKSNFTLLDQVIQFDGNTDPTFGSYSIVFWNQSGEAEEVGYYTFYPSIIFSINTTKIQWFTNGDIPTSLCSKECRAGYSKKQDGIHTCCFNCLICRNGTYINTTDDPFNCVACKETEWSPAGSTSCNLRVVEFIPLTDIWAILIMIVTWVFVGFTAAVFVLFAINYNTPIVRSAGGLMCFLILGCLVLCSTSVFFYFGAPSVSFCIMRFLPFLLFYTVCLACFVVRSFQIVCVFKMAAKYPTLYSWWMKYHGQWLFISAAFLTQALLLTLGNSLSPSKPFNDTQSYHDKIILTCDINLPSCLIPGIFLFSLCSLCFIFSYMGKDLPKNYNEAKAITFCLLLLILTWIIFATESSLYRGKHLQTLNALAVLSSLYCFLLWYFLPKCYIIIFEPNKNTQQHFQGLIQSYTKTISQ